MNRLYDVALNALLAGTLDLAGDPLAVAAGEATVFDPTAPAIGGVAGLLANVNRPVLAGVHLAGKALLADAVTYATTGGGEPFIRSLIVHRQSDGLLVAYIDTRPDLLPFNVAAEVPVRFSWAGGTVLTL